MSESVSTWPEQNAVWAWMERHGITLTMEQENDLKEAVSAPRISEQEARINALDHIDFLEDVKQTAERRADKAIDALRAVKQTDCPECKRVAHEALQELDL